MQIAIVAVVVFACSVYAAWTLLPSAARRGIAQRSLKLPLPPGAAAFMRRHATAASGCGCDGCDHAPSAAGARKAAPATAQPIVFHPQKRG